MAAPQASAYRHASSRGPINSIALPARRYSHNFAGSQPAIRDWILRNLPSMPPKAYRWVPETEEIAATFAAVGLTPLTMQGAASMYVAIAKTSVGTESPEEARARKRSGAQVIAALDKELP